MFAALVLVLVVVAFAMAGGAITFFLEVSMQNRAVVGAALLFGAAVAGGLAGVVAYASVKKMHADARRGWNLRPVVVAAVDLPAGATLSFDHLSQRSVPEQFITDSIVRPEQASQVVSQRLRIPIKAGDPVIWGHVGVGLDCP